MSLTHGQTFSLPLPEILLNGSTSWLGSVTAVSANPNANALVDGQSINVYTQLRKLGQFAYQYALVPGEFNHYAYGPNGIYYEPTALEQLLAGVTTPCTITFNVPAGCFVHYSFAGYPGPKADNISCFRYSQVGDADYNRIVTVHDNLTVGQRDVNRRTLTNPVNGRGIYVYAVAYQYNTTPGALYHHVLPNVQSPLLVAKFHLANV